MANDRNADWSAVFGAVLHQMPSGVVIAEAPSGKILLSNERARQIRRCPLPRGIGLGEYGAYDDKFRGFRPDGQAYRPEEWPLARSIRTGEVIVDEEIFAIRGDGSSGVLVVNSSPVYDEKGRIMVAVTVFYDITERRRAEDRVRALNEELEERVIERTVQLEEKSIILDTALGNLAEGVLLVNLRHQVLFANPAARTMLSIEDKSMPMRLADLQGRLEGWGDFKLSRAVARCAKEREDIQTIVHSRDSFMRLDMKHIPQFEAGRGGVLVVIEDLSAERKLEANQQRFLANAAHELKTPLTTIMGAADLLLTGGELTEVQHQLLQHISEEADRMQRLSETLLALARTGWDFREPEMQAGRLEAVRKAVERMQPLAERMGVTLLFEDRGGHACVDPEWLEQAFLTLVSNALKFSNTGGRVWVAVDGSTITITDEGSGIKEAHLPHVFERFYRGESGSGGFGLGLPLCKELIERMGGNISIYAREGVGTVATIKLREA